MRISICLKAKHLTGGLNLHEPSSKETPEKRQAAKLNSENHSRPRIQISHARSTLKSITVTVLQAYDSY